MLLLRKTGGVLRFFDHGGAARFYKRGNCRGIWVEIVLDFSSRAVGFLVNGAQRASLKRNGESEKRRLKKQAGRPQHNLNLGWGGRIRGSGLCWLEGRNRNEGIILLVGGVAVGTREK